MKTIRIGEREIQVADVKIDLIVEWICPNCKLRSFIAGYMTPEIMSVSCKHCHTPTTVDARLGESQAVEKLD